RRFRRFRRFRCFRPPRWFRPRPHRLPHTRGRERESARTRARTSCLFPFYTVTAFGASGVILTGKMPSRRASLRAKLVGASLLPTLVLLGVFGYFAQERGRRSLDEELGRRLISIAQSASAVVMPSQFATIQPEDESTQTYLSVRHKLA